MSARSYPASLFRLGALALFALTLTSGAQAKETKLSDEFVAFYNVISSTFLQPNVAETYGIERGEGLAVLVVSVQKTVDDGENKARTATVSGRTSNLIQEEKLQFDEVREGDAIYYVSQFRFDNGEPRAFTLVLEPEGSSRSHEIKFTETLYHN